MYYGDVDGQDFKLCQLLENLQGIEHFADQPIDGKFCTSILEALVDTFKSRIAWL